MEKLSCTLVVLLSTSFRSDERQCHQEVAQLPGALHAGPSFEPGSFARIRCRAKESDVGRRRSCGRLSNTLIIVQRDHSLPPLLPLMHNVDVDVVSWR